MKSSPWLKEPTLGQSFNYLGGSVTAVEGTATASAPSKSSTSLLGRFSRKALSWRVKIALDKGRAPWSSIRSSIYGRGRRLDGARRVWGHVSGSKVLTGPSRPAPHPDVGRNYSEGLPAAEGFPPPRPVSSRAEADPARPLSNELDKHYSKEELSIRDNAGYSPGPDRNAGGRILMGATKTVTYEISRPTGRGRAGQPGGKVPPRRRRRASR